MADIERTIDAARADPSAMPEELAYRRLPLAVEILFAAVALAGIALSLNHLLNLQFFVGYTLLETRYLVALGGLFLSLVFLAYPARPSGHDSPPSALDWVCFAATLVATAWLVANGYRALTQGWEYAAPNEALAIAGLFVALVVEGTRRAGGTTLAVVVAVVGLYPLVAGIMPGPIRALPQPLSTTLGYHVFSTQSAFGIPMKAFGELVVGFIVFGVALNYTGGGKFFNDLAFALVGRVRGGAAQVGVVSSGLQGSISGSVISNVISSGVVTIPAMIRTGFSRRYAGAVEAIASTGGVLMPPVMGSTAFVMAGFLGVPYAQIAVAAAVPALLMYFGLMVQIDAYAARHGLRGLPAAELPRLAVALREGWSYIIVFVVLVWFMLRENDEVLAPFYATAVLLAINQLDPRYRFDGARLLAFLSGCGRSLGELTAVLLGVGLIVGAFSVTGLAGTLANDLVFLAGDQTMVLLLMGALTSFIFGMGMTATACYIFLAITLAPALARQGLDPMAVHLFVFYWGMVSFVTPPVALAAFAAATIARTGPIGVGIEASRLGAVIYFLPFFFVLDPALILKGTLPQIALAITTAMLAIVVIAAGLQGYLIGRGRIGAGPAGWAARALLIGGGVGVGLGDWRYLGLGPGRAWPLAFGLVACALGALLVQGRRGEAPAR